MATNNGHPTTLRSRLARIAIIARGYWNEWTYAYELCQDCESRVGPHTGSWWHADDALWNEVVGSPWGVFCPPCFTRRCDDLGIHIFWHARVEYRDGQDVQEGQRLAGLRA